MIDEVLKDHGEIKQLFAQVQAATGERKRGAFEALVRKLAVHETAEQEVVHPLTGGVGAEKVRDDRLAEEKQAELVLDDLLRMGPEDPRFQSEFEKLKADVLMHAAMEESREHPKIRASVDAARLRQLATVFRAAEATAPTRPHRRGPTSAIGNIAVGPVVSIMDRARDAVRAAMRKLSG